jgi:hypothetical protein
LGFLDILKPSLVAHNVSAQCSIFTNLWSVYCQTVSLSIKEESTKRPRNRFKNQKGVG